MPKDWVDVQGRWKNKDGSRATDRYADLEMQALGAQVAAILCCGGSMWYVMSMLCIVEKRGVLWWWCAVCGVSCDGV